MSIDSSVWIDSFLVEAITASLQVWKEFHDILVKLLCFENKNLRKNLNKCLKFYNEDKSHEQCVSFQ